MNILARLFYAFQTILVALPKTYFFHKYNLCFMYFFGMANLLEYDIYGYMDVLSRYNLEEGIELLDIYRNYSACQTARIMD